MVVHVITGLERGGAETSLLRLLMASSNPTQHHVVSLADDGVYASQLRNGGVSVTSLGIDKGRRVPRAFFQLVLLLRKLRPEVVQTWMYHADLFGGLAARLVGVPVSWGVRQSNLSPEVNKRSTLRVARACALLSRFVPSRIVSCSARAAEHHRAFGYGGTFVIIHNGIDPSNFYADRNTRRAKRVELGVGESEFLIGHVGRYDLQKDYSTLFAACGKLRESHPHFRVVLCGRDITVANAEICSLRDQHGLSNVVSLLGPRDDVPQLLRAFDILVLSSNGEAFPNVLAEAMASGVPCVSTDVGDAAEIIGDTGWVVPPKNPHALAEGMGKALTASREELEVRGENARRRIRNQFALTDMVERYLQVWSEIQLRQY